MFLKGNSQTCLFWGTPLQLWSTHSVAKSQRAVYFQFPFSVEACWGFAVITDLNWSFFTPATNLRSIRKAHISQNCSVTRQRQTQSVSGESSSRMFGVWWWYVKLTQTDVCKIQTCSRSWWPKWIKSCGERKKHQLNDGRPLWQKGSLQGDCPNKPQKHN